MDMGATSVNEQDRKLVENMIAESVTSCSKRCLTWPGFIGIMVSVVAIILGSVWTLTETKVDAKTFEQYIKNDKSEKAALAREICSINQTVTMMYNLAAPNGLRRSIPDCDSQVLH
jgi:hypothetical protein